MSQKRYPMTNAVARAVGLCIIIVGACGWELYPGVGIVRVAIIGVCAGIIGAAIIFESLRG